MAKTRKKSNIPLPKQPRQNVQKPTIVRGPNAQVWIDLQNNKWLSSIRNKKFTNFLYSSEECLNSYYKVLSEIIPKVQSEWENIKGRRPGYYHCHQLHGAEDELAREIYHEIYKHQLDEGVDIWQFGFTGATRLVCIHNDNQNALIPIFVDHNHIIYESQKHNQPDYSKHKYCLICAHK